MKYIYKTFVMVVFLMFCIALTATMGKATLKAYAQDAKPDTIKSGETIAKVEEPKLPALDEDSTKTLKPLVAQRDQIIAQAQVLYKQLNDLNNQLNDVNLKWHLVEETALGKAQLDYTQYMIDITGTKFAPRVQQSQPTPQR